MDEDRAERIREHVKRAGITRAALFAESKATLPFRFHDFRSTYLTWRAIRGDSPVEIQAAGRHRTFQTTSGYVNAATLLRKADIGAPFAPLPASLLEVLPPVLAFAETSDKNFL